MEILLFEDTYLNSNPKIVSSIMSKIKNNDGYCPCNQPYEDIKDTECPCRKYRETHDCCCTLYIKK